MNGVGDRGDLNPKLGVGDHGDPDNLPIIGVFDRGEPDNRRR